MNHRGAKLPEQLVDAYASLLKLLHSRAQVIGRLLGERCLGLQDWLVIIFAVVEVEAPTRVIKFGQLGAIKGLEAGH